MSRGIPIYQRHHHFQSSPNHAKQYQIECDASYYASGAVLSQEQPDSTWRPIAFASWTMTPAQRNYQIYDKEFLAVINALKEWKRYIIGAPKTTEIITDHKNLEFYHKPQNLTRWQADWVSKLQEYDITLSHRPGRLHTQADFQLTSTKVFKITNQSLAFLIMSSQAPPM